MRRTTFTYLFDDDSGESKAELTVTHEEDIDYSRYINQLVESVRYFYPDDPISHGDITIKESS